MTRKLLLALFLLVLVAAFGLGFYYLRQTQQLPLLPGSSSEIASETGIVFRSEIPGLKIESVDEEVLRTYLNRLGFSSFENIPFIGVDTSRVISPEKITVTFRPSSRREQDLAENKIQRVKQILAVNNAVFFYAGDLSDDGKSLEIKTYIKEDRWENKENLNLALTELALESLFYNFQRPPLSALGGHYGMFIEKLQPFNEPIFKATFGRSQTFLHEFQELFTWPVAQAYTIYQNATCSGSVACGDLENIKECDANSGPRSGQPCQSQADCKPLGFPNGSCQIVDSTCTANNTSVACFTEPQPGGGNQCRVNTCFGCDFAVNCTIVPDAGGGATPPPGSTPPPPPPPPGGYGACGSCGNCDNNPPGSGSHPSSECRLDPSNNCVWDISCRGAPPPPPPPLPTCTIDLNPNGVDINNGANASIVASTSATDGTVSQVSFASSNTAVATVNPGTDTTSPFSTQVTGVGLGSANISATATVTGPGGTNTCSTTTGVTDTEVNVTASGAWWQAINADVGGDILISLIPTTTCTGACTPSLILDGAGGFPGVATYSVSYDFAAGSSQGTASSKNWLVQSGYQGKIYDYDYFARQIPPDVVINELASDTVNGGDFNSGGTPSRGYVWYRRSGNLTINGNVNLVGSRKVVLLVDGGNLNLNGRITIQSPGNGFFMTIVGRANNGRRGDIIVDGSVSHPTQPELQGVFMADSELKIFAGTQQLHIKGVVVAWDRVVLRRDLGAGNSNTPAQVFEYDPTLLFTFPREFFRNRLVWREVAP